MFSNTGYEKMHDNKRENRQFHEATKGLSKEDKRKLHDEITGLRYSFKEIFEARKK